ncbi:MAG: selB [Actinomycetia bacterium]|nr:selB [Actinomycetes bacterium]
MFDAGDNRELAEVDGNRTRRTGEPVPTALKAAEPTRCSDTSARTVLPMLVMATAGHVDHGKSTLVRVLTGTDPDRCAEEKRRGLTIDLGYAELLTPGGRSIAFVDVPGHVRFVANMLAGVGAVAAALFVVDVNEGWKPQSEEHLRILDLVGVTDGLVVLTKVAGVDPDVVERIRAEVVDALTGSGLAHVPVLAVDALAGAGIGDLLAQLDRLAGLDRVLPTGRARLWVDRSFTIAGAGTVVTGTLTGGTLRRGDEVEVGDRRVRIRRLQSFGRDHDEVKSTSRVAVNLTGIDHGDVGRGDALVHPRRWRRTRVVDAAVSVLPSARRVSRRGALALHVGSGEHAIRLRVIGGNAIEPGQLGLARIDLPVALPLAPGDRFVLRDLGRGETIGGGQVLDVDPVLPLTRARPDRSVDRVVAERGWVRADELERLTGEARPPTLGPWVVDPARLAQERDELVARVVSAGPLGLDVAALDERARSVLGTTELVVAEGRARIARDRLDEHPLLALLAAAPFDPPAAAIDPAELALLVRRGLVVQQDGITFAPSAVDQAAALVTGLLAAAPEGITVAEVRQAMGTTRRFALPLLAVLDARGVTVRRGDIRIAGPAMSST